MTAPTMETVGPVYHALRALLPDGSRFGLGLREHPRAGVVVELDVIDIPTEHRGQGLGDTVVQRLCEAADSNGWTLTLRVSTDLSDDPARVDSWYARHGFQPDPTMAAGAWRIRSPKK